MPKRVAQQDRKTSPVITMLPLRLREQLEELARRRNVSLSEIGRQAITQYVTSNGEAA
jgi:hypothetical protein